MAISKNTVAALDDTHIRIGDRKYSVTKNTDLGENGDKRPASNRIETQWEALIDSKVDNRKFYVALAVGAFVLVWGAVALVETTGLFFWVGLGLAILGLLIIVIPTIRHMQAARSLKADLAQMTFSEFCQKRLPEFLKTLDFYGVNYNA